MKQLLLFTALYCQITVFAQVYNEYSTMPKTININVVQPMKPVKPVDYGALTSNLANDLNNISENRAAQKKAFDDMTSQAIRDVQNNKSLGYSSTLNDQMIAVQQETIDNINSYYFVLTNGIIDPADYSKYLTTIVNDYYGFAQSMNELNDKLKSTIDEMKSTNKYALIETLTTIIDDKTKNTTIGYNSEQGEKNRRYKNYYNLGFTYQQNGISISKSDYFRLYNTLFNDVNSITIDPNNSPLQNEINTDIILHKKHIFAEFSFDSPSTFKPSTEVANSWAKKYSDGTSVLISFNLDKKETYQQFGNSSSEAIDKIRALNNMNNKPNLRMFVDFDKNMVLTNVIKNGPGEIAGLKVGDKLLFINDLKIDCDSMVSVAKKDKKDGDTLNLIVERKGENKNFKLVLKADESCFNSFDIEINGHNGYLFAFPKKKIEYGEEIKEIVVTSVASVDNNLFSVWYIITPSINMSLKSNLEIFKTFKPLIKSINDSVVFN